MSEAIQTLPSLPEGWRYEPHSFDGEVVHVVWPDHGAVSVHFKRRTIATGWVIPNPASRDAAPKKGKGWKVALVAEAVAALKAAWE